MDRRQTWRAGGAVAALLVAFAVWAFFFFKDPFVLIFGVMAAACALVATGMLASGWQPGSLMRTRAGIVGVGLGAGIAISAVAAFYLWKDPTLLIFGLTLCGVTSAVAFALASNKTRASQP